MGLVTQQDPIGIAGGLNLYGYANGDPVNFSDPFGLCAEDDEGNEDPECRSLINIVNGVLAREGVSDHTREQLRGVVDVLELMTADVEFRYLPNNATCCSPFVTEQNRWRGGGNVGEGFSAGYLWVNVAMGPVEVAATAWHEIQHRKGRPTSEHAGIYADEAQVILGLPVWMQSQASANIANIRRRGHWPG